jgi:small subunit ribosomal protein S20
MAHSKQALKRVRTSRQARERNRAARTAVKTAIKRVSKAPDAAARRSAAALADQTIDKAAQRGPLHKNAARRLRSRMARRANKLG